MSRDMILRIMHVVRCYSHKTDATYKLDFTPYQKCITVIRMLAYGVAGDLVDEYIRMRESGCLEAMCILDVVAVYAELYLR
jgi:hypothetical protein